MEKLELFLHGGGYKKTTQETYRYYLIHFLGYKGDLANFSADEFMSWLQRWPDESTSQYMAYCAARAYLKFFYGNAHPALVIRVRRPESGPQRTLAEKEVERLLLSFDTSKAKGRRDLALVCLLLDTGLRASEVCRLEVRYLDLDERTLQVIIKGGQWRFAVFSHYTASCLASWMGTRKEVAKPGVKTVFVGIKGIKPGQSLTKDGLRTIMSKLAKFAGMKHFSPHALRRSFATIAARAGASDQVLMKQGGWASAAMVRRYTRALEHKDFEPFSPVSRTMRSNMD
jgi:integrase